MAEQQRQSLCPRLIDYLAIVGSRSTNIKHPGNGQNPPVQVTKYLLFIFFYFQCFSFWKMIFVFCTSYFYSAFSGKFRKKKKNSIEFFTEEIIVWRKTSENLDFKSSKCYNKSFHINWASFVTFRVTLIQDTLEPRLFNLVFCP